MPASGSRGSLIPDNFQLGQLGTPSEASLQSSSSPQEGATIGAKNKSEDAVSDQLSFSSGQTPGARAKPLSTATTRKSTAAANPEEHDSAGIDSLRAVDAKKSAQWNHLVFKRDGSGEIDSLPYIHPGAATYLELLNKATVVIDRTGFAVQLLTTNTYKNNIILVPRRSGKTCLVGALQLYCERRIDASTGTPPERFVDGKPPVQLECTKPFGPFGRFAAERDQQFIDKHYLNYSVVRLDFADIAGNDFASMQRSFLRDVIQREYERHFIDRNLATKLMLDQQAVETEIDAKFLQIAIQKQLDHYDSIMSMREDELDEGLLETSVNNLCQILHSAYDGGDGRERSVIVVIDEYDKVLNRLAKRRDDFNKMCEFLRGFFNQTCKQCEVVKKVVVLGSLPSNDGLNVISNDFPSPQTVLHNEYGRYFMLPSAVFNELAEAYQLSPNIRTRALMYGGYETPKGELYHLWSALLFLTNHSKAKSNQARGDALRPYWSFDETIEEYADFFRNHRVIMALRAIIGDDHNNRITIKDVSFTFTTRDLVELRAGDPPHADLCTELVDRFLQLLVFRGYLPVRDLQQHNVEYERGSRYVITCPNMETIRDIEERLTSAYGPTEKSTYMEFVRELQRFHTGQLGAARLAKALEQHLLALKGKKSDVSGKVTALRASSVPEHEWSEAIVKCEFILGVNRAGLLQVPEHTTQREPLDGTMIERIYGDMGTFTERLKAPKSRLMDPNKPDRARPGFIDLVMLNATATRKLLLELKYDQSGKYTVHDGFAQNFQYRPNAEDLRERPHNRVEHVTYAAIHVRSTLLCEYIVLKRNLVERDGEQVWVDDGGLETNVEDILKRIPTTPNNP